MADGAQGLRTIDLTDPARPREVGSYAIPSRLSWKLAVENGRAFVGVRTDGVRVIDTTDSAAPREVAAILPMANAAAVAARGDFAYLLTADEGLRVIDLTEPGRPRQRGQAAALQGTVGAIETIGERHVAVASVSSSANRTQLDIFDTGDPDRPARTASLPIFNIGRELFNAGEHTVIGNFIGVDVSGSRAVGTAMSVAIDASSNNIIRQNVMGGRSSIIDQGSCCNEIIEPPRRRSVRH